jgi:hypothetical protein
LVAQTSRRGIQDVAVTDEARPPDLVVSVQDDGIGTVTTHSGRPILIVFGDTPDDARRRIDEELAHLSPVVRPADAVELDLGPMPGEPEDIELDALGRWAAIGKSTSHEDGSDAGWCMASDRPGVVGFPASGSLSVHRVGDLEPRRADRTLVDPGHHVDAPDPRRSTRGMAR